MSLKADQYDRWPDHALRWFAILWLTGFALVIVAAIVGAFLTMDFSVAVGAVFEWFSPFNVTGFITNIISVSPAISAMLLLNYRRRNRA